MWINIYNFHDEILIHSWTNQSEIYLLKVKLQDSTAPVAIDVGQMTNGSLILNYWKSCIYLNVDHTGVQRDRESDVGDVFTALECHARLYCCLTFLEGLNLCDVGGRRPSEILAISMYKPVNNNNNKTLEFFFFFLEFSFESQ